MDTTPVSQTAPTMLEKAPRIHLGFIDSLRALAALFVAFGHAYAQLVPYQQALMDLNPKYEKLFSFAGIVLFRHGHLAVAVFIVISGFCLMLPLARHDRLEMAGFGSFMKRRARRILPPYYAALAVALLLFVLVPGMANVTKGEGFSALPPFGTWNLVSHLLLFHHWSDAWIIKIVPPFWSIGVEWQIYFLMPLLFLPLLRALGKVGMLATVALLGVGLSYTCAGVLPKLQTFIHFIALFAAGMVTAQVCFSPSAAGRRVCERFPAAKISFGVFAFVLALLLLQTRVSWATKPPLQVLGLLTWDNVWVMDYLVALSFCALLIALCQERKGVVIGKVDRFLHWAPLVFVGHFSYSLYLIHDPILRLVCTVGEALHFGPFAHMIAVFAVGMPLAVLAGYFLYLAVERHFIRSLPAHAKAM